MSRGPRHGVAGIGAVLACSLSVLLTASGCASGGRVNVDEIDAIVREVVATGGDASPGGSLVVARGGEILLDRSYGMADVEAQTATSGDTAYRLASITKQFTAAGVLRLVESGRLSLDQPVRPILPELPSAAAGVTVRHLLTHTSGLPDYEDLIPGEATEQVSDADVLDLIAHDGQMYFAPGDGYRYSNTGYALLVLLVERVANRPFPQFMREEVLGRAGMTDAVFHQEGLSTVPRRAYGYSTRDGAWTRTDQSTTSAVLGDGGLYASARELVRWIDAFHSGQVVSRPFAAMAVEPAVATDDAGVRYGFGWRISRHRDHTVHWHSGETIGFRNVELHFPDRGLSVVLLTNQNERSPRDAALRIANHFLD